MGRGNLNLSLPLRGGFFINHEHFNSYYDDDKEEIDEDTTQYYFDEFVNNFQEKFSTIHSEFSVVNDGNKILKSFLFDILIEDNEWSQAIRFKPTRDIEIWGQDVIYNYYLESMKHILLDMLDYIEIYAGPWTSGIIRKGGE